MYFAVVLNTLMLITKQLSNHSARRYVCQFCLNLCASQDALDKHKENCRLHEAQRIKMPQQGQEELRDTKVEYQARLPFIIYADFESILESKEMVEKDPSRSWTEKY